MSKWSDEEGVGVETARVGVSVGKKWNDEEDDDEVLESWDAAEDSEEEREKEEKAKKAAEAAAAAKKSKTQRIAEKQAENAAKRAAEEAEKSALDDETPEEHRRRMQEREIQADLNHAVDLFAGAVVEDIADHGVTSNSAALASPAAGVPSPSSDVKHKAIAIADPADSAKSIDLSSLPLFKPTTKKQFTDLQNTLAPLLVQNIKKPNYPLFVQELTRLLIKDMSSEQIRKVASMCTTLTNEKLREEKAAEKGVKKTKAQKTKTTLVGVGGKDNDRLDMKSYDDFGDDDFM
ncbi:eukaryotic translation initiation factor 3 subunit J [Tirmania nivea]|nr:eukaryotic translation initiation factor 3 subunit J [Tirmania nivea]